jgi:allantoicase
MLAPVPASLPVVPFTQLLDLAASNVGGRVLQANDEFFAEKENLLSPQPAVFLPDKYTERGKWMDGWETRRKRTPGHDWCIVRLGLPGLVHGVNVDTAFFVGNFPESCKIEAVRAPAGGPDPDERAPWRSIVPQSRLQGGSQNLFAVLDRGPWTHLRLNIYPDGGVARLRVHGEVQPEWQGLAAKQEPVDVAAAAHGGVVMACNDMFFGRKDNLIMPGRAAHMGEGWETRRRRGPGHDWIVVQLGARVRLQRVEVSTHHFKGNYPDRCSLDACDLGAERPVPVAFLHPNPSIPWREVLPAEPLRADTEHVFGAERLADAVVTHVRLNIYPDGGISRLRVFGELA